MPSNFLNPFSKSFYALQTAIWSAYWAATRIGWLVYTAPPWENMVSHKVLGLLASTAMAFVFWRIRDKHFWWQISNAILMTSIFGVVWGVAYNIVDIHLLRDSPPANLTAINYFWSASMAILRLMPWTIGYFLLTYYTKFVQQERLAREADLLAKDAQLKLLHLQIRPHFLFNVLNSLDTLLMKKDTAEARKMLNMLSLFLRQTLSEAPSDMVTLNDEIARVCTYIEIEKVRFQDKLQIAWNIDAFAKSAMVPSLILQPLLENAIKHSVSQSIHGSEITISATRQDGPLQILVKNKANGVENDEESKGNGLGIGLDNTRKRLKAIYGKGASLRAHQTREGSYDVCIVIDAKEAAGN